jgi:hypothetical protein
MTQEEYSKLFKKVSDAREEHDTFLSATEKNLSYYIFGKEVPLVRQNLTFPEVDFARTLQGYVPKAYNPMADFIDSFIDEIANSDLVINVHPYPVRGKEPYNSYANQLEDYLENLHIKNKKKKYLRPILLETLEHSYFTVYTDGTKYWFLSGYDFFPGDPLINDIEEQPFVSRITSVTKAALLKRVPSLDLNKEILAGWQAVDDLDTVTLYDTWFKPLDKNIMFTEGGQVVWDQPFPYPKRYPFFKNTDNEMLNSFYSKPAMQILRLLLEKYQNSIENVEESSKSIANPILTYDADAGIDVDALQRALKEGYKRIIVGKNKEGNIGFVAPGHLPDYSLKFPEIVETQMLRKLGLTLTFLGSPTQSIRERGAIGQLVKTAFRKLGSVSALLERTFAELDNYLIEYAQAHQMKMEKESRMLNVEEIFQSKVIYIAKESFKSFGSEDTLENKNLAMLKWKTKLIGQEEALRELGHHQPKKIMAEQLKEMKEGQEFAVKVQREAQTPPKDLMQEIHNHLKGNLKFRYFLSQIADDKILIKCQVEDVKEAAFLLSDFADKVMIDPIFKKEVPTSDQKTSEVEVEKPPVPEIPVEQKKKKIPLPPKSPEYQTPEKETRGRPEEKSKTFQEEVEKSTESSMKETSKKKEQISTAFSEDRLKNLIARTHPVKRPERFFNLPGLYIAEPHARWIREGKKSLLLMGKKLDIINKPHLLCGHKVYGIITIRDIIEDFNIDETQKFHLVNPEQRKKWWGNRKVYLYLFEFHPFPEPFEYNRPAGVQTFINKVDFKSEKMGVPYTGDLKPTSISPWKLPVVHKPEKKAFQPQEVFSISRLKDRIPEGIYDVSEKIDGLRCRVWIHDGKVKLYSDTAAEFTKNRVAPLLEQLAKIFKKDALLDGELVMEGIRRKDVSGYVHSKGTPTPEQLKSLRFVCWDILYIGDKSIADRPFGERANTLDLYLKKGCKGQICRVQHSIAKRVDVGAAVKRLTSVEGAVIRDNNAAYWATHSTYKMKHQFDVDARVFAATKTKNNLPIFFCETREGIYIGSTYAQSEVKAKPGDVIRVNVDHVSIRPDGSINWYAPKPKSFKEGKITPKKISTTQTGIGGPDRIDLLKEIYLVSGGSQERWNKWEPKFQEWKKEKMPELKEGIKKKARAGVAPAKII